MTTETQLTRMIEVLTARFADIDDHARGQFDTAVRALRALRDSGPDATDAAPIVAFLELLERSSLGTLAAEHIRSQTPIEDVAAVLARAGNTSAALPQPGKPATAQIEVAAAVRRDAEFAEFFRAQWPELNTLLATLGYQREDAADIVYQVLSRASRLCFSFTSENRGDWVRREVIREWLRRAPIQAVDARERESVVGFLDSRSRVLTYRQRQVLALHCEGLRMHAIGRRLGISEDTVRVHMRRAEDNLMRHLQSDAVATSDATEPSPTAGSAHETAVAQGVVKWFNSDKGYGYISREDGGPDVFVHYSAIQGGRHHVLEENQRVEFEIGGQQAQNVRAHAADSTG